jgi:hypothetical protein
MNEKNEKIEKDDKIEQLQWVADHICDFMGWDRNDVMFTKVTLAEIKHLKSLITFKSRRKHLSPLLHDFISA